MVDHDTVSEAPSRTSDASGIGPTSYVAVGPDGREHWPEDVLRSGDVAVMPAQAAGCSTMIYVESVIKSGSEMGVAGFSVSFISCMYWNGLTV